jgi:hypothetical protein
MGGGVTEGDCSNGWRKRVHVTAERSAGSAAVQAGPGNDESDLGAVDLIYTMYGIGNLPSQNLFFVIPKEIVATAEESASISLQSAAQDARQCRQALVMMRVILAPLTSSSEDEMIEA